MCLVGVAVGASGLAGQESNPPVPAGLIEADARPALVVLPLYLTVQHLFLAKNI